MPKIWPEKEYENFTAEMVKQIPEIDLIKYEILYCHLNAHSARNAGDFSLPKMGAKRGITAGEREAIYGLSLYWITRRDASVRLLMWREEYFEWFDKHGIPYRVLGAFGKLKD